MGTLRTLLALGVVIGHMGTAAPLQLVGGGDAVRIFYMISGYLMSLVLVESRAYDRVRSFYLSRLLRLFPVYAAVAAVSLVTYLALDHGEFLAAYASTGWVARIALVLSNLFIVGQAQVMFLAQVDGRLVFPTSFAESDPLIYQGLLIPPAWTLEIELLFYLVAPFLLPRRRWIFVTLGLSLLVRGVLLLAGLGFTDPWSYRFFPAELVLFLAGALAHQILAPWYDARLDGSAKDRLSAYALATVAAYVFLMPLVPAPNKIVELGRAMPLYAGTLLILPLLLHFQNRNRLDARIGELSYPIYVCHWLPIMVLQPHFLAVDFYSTLSGQMAGLSLVILLAWLLNRAVAHPVERVRRHLRAHARPRGSRQGQEGGTVAGLADHALALAPSPAPTNPAAAEAP